MPQTSFILPDWALPGIFNNDISGLSTQDCNELAQFITDTYNAYKSSAFNFSIDESVGYKHSNDINTMGADCTRVTLNY